MGETFAEAAREAGWLAPGLGCGSNADWEMRISGTLAFTTIRLLAQYE
jgi:hypothetical protein